ncbi:MAG TPA: transcriptional repressor [Candidatus Dormibacteraeota bacterium]|nr:transcriptional repressor [Candidatus Dormibacteraeota bacterium]
MPAMPHSHPTGPKVGPGGRATKQRRIVWEAIGSLGPHCTVDEIVEKVGLAEPGIARSTIYRAVNTMTEAGNLVATRLDGGPLRYEIGSQTHVHTVCQVCGAVDHLGEDDPIPDVESELADRGFRPIRIEITATGVCRACATRRRRPAPTLKS